MHISSSQPNQLLLYPQNFPILSISDKKEPYLYSKGLSTLRQKNNSIEPSQTDRKDLCLIPYTVIGYHGNQTHSSRLISK